MAWKKAMNTEHAYRLSPKGHQKRVVLDTPLNSSDNNCRYMDDYSQRDKMMPKPTTSEPQRETKIQTKIENTE